MAEESNESTGASVGAVFVDVGLNLSKLHTDGDKAKTEAASIGKDIAAALTRAGKPVFGPDWAKNLARERAKIASWGKSSSPQQEKEDQFLRDQIMSSVKKVGVIKGSQRGGMLDSMMGLDAQKGRAAPTAAELALYKQGDKDRGMALEKAMAREQKELQRAAAEEAKRSAKEAQTAWQVAQKAAADHAKVVAQRWKALGDYIKGDMMKLHGRSLWEDFSNGASKAFSIVGGAAKIFFAPLTLALSAIKEMIPLLLAAAGAAATFGAMAFRSAMKFETLKTQVGHMIGGSTAGLERQANYVQGRTPFSNTDALMALGRMQSRGLVGRQVAGGLANFAAITGGTMTGAAQQLSSGRTYQLRQYGIEQSKGKEGMVVKFQMPDEKQVRLVGQTFAQNTMNLLQAVNMKFSGAAVAAAKTMSGIFSQIKNLAGDVLRQFGEGLLPFGKGVGTLIVNALNRGLASGKFKEWGENVGKWLLNAAAHIGAFIKTMPTVIEEFGKLFKNPKTFTEALFEALKAGALLIGRLFAVAVQGTFEFWKGIGELIASIFRQSFLNFYANLGIPGSGAAEAMRAEMMGKGAKSLMEEFNATPGIYDTVSPEDAWAAFQKKYPALKGMDLEQLSSRVEGVSGFRLGSEENKKFFEGGAGRFIQGRGSSLDMSAAIKSLIDIPKNMLAESGPAWAAFQEAIAAILKAAGVDTSRIGTEFDANVKQFQDFFKQFSQPSHGVLRSDMNPEGGAAEDTPLEARSASFSEWVKVAQEATLKAKVADGVERCADSLDTIKGKVSKFWM